MDGPPPSPTQPSPGKGRGWASTPLLIKAGNSTVLNPPLAKMGRVSSPRPSVRDAFRATRRRWPALVAGTMVYGIIITLCTVGLTFLLRDLRIDVTNIGRVNADLNDMARAIAIRTLGTV